MLQIYIFRYHPDKNANDPAAADTFKVVTFSYNILSDPDKRRQYDTAGFEVSDVSWQLDVELGWVILNTALAWCFSRFVNVVNFQNDCAKGFSQYFTWNSAFMMCISLRLNFLQSLCLEIFGLRCKNWSSG